MEDSDFEDWLTEHGYDIDELSDEKIEELFEEFEDSQWHSKITNYLALHLKPYLMPSFSALAL